MGTAFSTEQHAKMLRSSQGMHQRPPWLVAVCMHVNLTVHTALLCNRPVHDMLGPSPVCPACKSN